jgi:hypothetical protein
MPHEDTRKSTLHGQQRMKVLAKKIYHKRRDNPEECFTHLGTDKQGHTIEGKPSRRKQLQCHDRELCPIRYHHRNDLKGLVEIEEDELIPLTNETAAEISAAIKEKIPKIQRAQLSRNEIARHCMKKTL